MKLFVISIFGTFLFAACNTNNNPTPSNPGNVNTQQPYQHWIPNWPYDTLVGVGFDTIPYRIDPFISATIGDSSVVYYGGQKYYIWTENKVMNQQGQVVHEFEDNNNGYNNCFISKVPFSNSQADLLTTAMVSPSKYFDSNYNQWRTQDQTMMVDQKPPLPIWVQMGFYSTNGKQYLSQ